MVSLWDLKIFTQGSGFSRLALSKVDMFESNVLFTAWARVCLFVIILHSAAGGHGIYRTYFLPASSVT
jgi:hypothetical protein